MTRVIWHGLLFSGLTLLACGATMATAEAPAASFDSRVIEVRALQDFLGASGDEGEELRVTSHSSVQYSCLQEARRVFVETPDSGSFVLEAVATPGKGTARWRWIDDSSGWWIELQERTEASFAIDHPSSHGFPLFNERYFGENHDASWTLRVNGQELASIDSTLQDWDVIPRLAQSLLDDDAQPVALTDAPASAIAGLLLLDSLARTESCQGTPVAEFGRLAQAVAPLLERIAPDVTARYASIAWQPKQLGVWRGSTPETEAEVEFLSQFRFGDAVDAPLAGLEAPAGGGCPDGS